MIFVENLIKTLKKNKISFFTGVPDSILTSLSRKLENYPIKQHVIATNEGSAVAFAAGYYLAKKKMACVYLQNSGLGNAINPLISIAHPKVYSVPLLLLIGWRGSPFVKADEPQHNEKGKITRKLLKLLGIKFIILRTNQNLYKIKDLLKFAQKKNKPVAILLEKNTLSQIKPEKTKKQNKSGIKRDQFILQLLKNIKKGTKIVSTTGYTSRELHQIRKKGNFRNGKDFYMVGGMGHSLMVSLGYALKNKNNVICLDGDGSALMHLGSLRTAGIFKKRNLKHIVLNNFCHESVGEQTTFSENLKFGKVAKDLGYRNIAKIDKVKNLTKNLNKFLNSNGPSLLEVITKTGTLKNLDRPKEFIKIKKQFIK